MQEHPLQPTVQLQVHWFCPACDEGLTSYLELHNQSTRVHKKHEPYNRRAACKLEWFTVHVADNTVQVVLTSREE